MLQAMDDVLEQRYETVEPEGDFARLLDTVAAGRDDSRLVRIALDIYGKVQSHPAPGAWLVGQQRAFALEGVADAGETPWGALLLEQAERQAEYWQGQMMRALELAWGEEKLSKGYAPSLSATLEGLRAFREAAAQGWDPGPRNGWQSPSPVWARCGAAAIPRPRSGSRPYGRSVKSAWESWRSCSPSPADGCWKICARYIRRCGDCLRWWRTSHMPIRR